MYAYIYIYIYTHVIIIIYLRQSSAVRYKSQYRLLTNMAVREPSPADRRKSRHREDREGLFTNSVRELPFASGAVSFQTQLRSPLEEIDKPGRTSPWWATLTRAISASTSRGSPRSTTPLQRFPLPLPLPPPTPSPAKGNPSMLCPVLSCPVLSCHVMSCNVIHQSESSESALRAQIPFQRIPRIATFATHLSCYARYRPPPGCHGGGPVLPRLPRAAGRAGRGGRQHPTLRQKSRGISLNS